MYPTVNSRGEYMLISRMHNHGKGIEVGDLVRFYHPYFAGVHAAKRVLGMPGDFVCKDLPYDARPGETGEMIQVCGFFFFFFRFFSFSDRNSYMCDRCLL